MEILRLFYDVLREIEQTDCTTTQPFADTILNAQTNVLCISLLGIAESLVFGTIRCVKLNLYIVYIFLCWYLRQGL